MGPDQRAVRDARPEAHAARGVIYRSRMKIASPPSSPTRPSSASWRAPAPSSSSRLRSPSSSAGCRLLSLGVLYIFAVLPVAVLWGLALAARVSVASMLAFNWFFLPPTHTFQLRDGANWAALAVYLVTAVVVSALAARARRRAELAELRERERSRAPRRSSRPRRCAAATRSRPRCCTRSRTTSARR